MSIGQNIKRQRKALGLTLDELAKRMGMSKQTLSKYENDLIVSIPIERIEALSEVLDISPGLLMGWEEEGPAQKDEAERAEFMRLYEKAPAWLQTQVRSLLESAEAAREAPDGDPKAR